MTREEAIKIIERVDICANAAETARDMAIAALKEPVLVRCKDCKHYGYDPYDNGDKCCVLWGEWIFPHDDDFCSCGERRSDG